MRNLAIGKLAILLASVASATALAQQSDPSEAIKEDVDSMKQAQDDIEKSEAPATGDDSSVPTNTGSTTETSSSTSSERVESRSRSSDFSIRWDDRKEDGRNWDDRNWGGSNSNWSVDSVLGKWTIGDKDGSSSCSLTLYPDESFGLRRAWTTVGCPDGFFSVNRWRAAGRDLQLTDMSGKVIGSFRQVGPGRFEGRRQSDGAAMYLSR
ncbi:AprI/Inh family metalloprotease inhibitor [Sphingomonas sp. MS122]|uniref:AprI/Inh family metalloprotease inhibitor n=1 Tax=Sphingomonas sp. MS122 TaxID=3412683 RepID=UPI003C2F3A75